MNDESRLWLQYAEENRRVAVLCFENGLFNPCLQNAQQAVESLNSGVNKLTDGFTGRMIYNAENKIQSKCGV